MKALKVVGWCLSVVLLGSSLALLAPRPQPVSAAATAQASGRLDVFGRGLDNALWYDTFDGGSWTGWRSLGGRISAEPSAVTYGDGRIDVFARGKDYSLYRLSFDGSWGGWERLGAVLASGPAAVTSSAERVDVFAVGLDGTLWQKTSIAGVWSRWRSLGGGFKSNPGAASSAPGQISVFGRGLDDAIWTRSFDGAGWSAWRSLGGGFTSAPGVSSWGSGRMDVFGAGLDHALWHRSFTGSGWTAWESLGGVISSDPSAASTGVGSIDVFARGLDAAMYHTAFNGSWTGWARLGGAFIGSTDALPAPVSHSLPGVLAGYYEMTRLPTTSKVVALTFDGGSGDEGFAKIVNALSSSGVTGTFFLTGQWVDSFPAEARQLGAVSSYSFANHSYDHPPFTQLSNQAIDNEVSWAERMITRATGRQPWPLFRFPYGDRDTRTVNEVKRLGYGNIGWTVDTLGWKGTQGGISVDTVVQRALGAAQPGEIILMHIGAAPDGSTLDADALPRVIQGLKAKGYSFVAIGHFLFG